MLGKAQCSVTQRTLARHAVTSQVVADGAGAAAAVLRGGEAELRTSSVVDLARVSPCVGSRSRDDGSRRVMRHLEREWVSHPIFFSTCQCV